MDPNVKVTIGLVTTVIEFMVSKHDGENETYLCRLNELRNELDKGNEQSLESLTNLIRTDPIMCDLFTRAVANEALSFISKVGGELIAKSKRGEVTDEDIRRSRACLEPIFHELQQLFRRDSGRESAT